MATYNFTIRATDTAGAFADRTFSINVNNTTLDRFVVAGANGLARSVDGITWKTEPGRSGTGVTYGNGRWVVWKGDDTATTKTLHTSPDGVNWSTLSLTSSSSAGAFDIQSLKVGGQGFSCVKYINNRWVAFTFNANNTQATAAIQCYESTNLQTWTTRGDVQTNVGSQSFFAGITDVTYGNGMYIAVGGWINNASGAQKAIYTSPDLITWTKRVSFDNASNTTGGSSILNVNGLFIASLYGGAGSSATNIYTSPDGTTWTPRTHQVGATGLVYVNGRILNLAGASLYRSLDAGQTWTSTASGLTAATQNHAALMNGCTLASYGNTVLSAVVKGANTNIIYRFNAEGVSLGSVTLDVTNVGTVRGVAARP